MKLIKYLKPYWYLAILSPVFMVIEVIIDLLQPRLMSKIIDNGVLASNMSVIISTGILMIILTIIGGIGGVGAAGFGSAASQSFGNDLRNDAFKRVMTLSLEQTDKFTTGSLVTRLTNDITSVQDLVAMALRMFIRAPFMFIGGIIMALTLNVNFGLVLVVALPIQVILIWLLISKASPLFSIVQKKLDKVNSVVQENITGARVVKAYVREEYENSRFMSANNDLMNTSFRVQKLIAILNPMLMIIMNLSVVAIIFVGGLQIQAKNMQVGQVMAAITYTTQILMSIMMVSMMFQSISRAKASSERIIEILDTTTAVPDGNYIPDKFIGNVEFKNVSFNYPGFLGRPVLQNVNLEIKQGETVAILGATGSGKTSLVNLLPRFYDVVQGEVDIDSVNVKEYSLEALRSKIGIVLQKTELFSGSIMDNILWGDENASEEEAVRAAKIAQADEYINSFNDGYSTILGEKGTSLSGGQKQRLAIARAILKKPEILIFDDSTSALDLGTEARLQKALKDNLQDTTIIIIAQRVASIMNADRIIVLDNGNIAACGTHDELINSSDVYKDIYNSQIRQEVELNG